MRNRKQNSIRRWKNRMRKSRRGKQEKKEENSNTNKNNKKERGSEGGIRIQTLSCGALKAQRRAGQTQGGAGQHRAA